MAGYAGVDFVLACEDLNNKWGPYTQYDEQMASINRLCLDLVKGPLLPRYGFSPDETGSKEFDAAVTELALSDAQIKTRSREVASFVLKNFTRLGVVKGSPLSQGRRQR